MTKLTRIAALAAAATFALSTTTACSGVKSSCKGNSCTVTVTGEEDVEATILKADWEFDAVTDDSIEVEVDGEEKVIREGETATVGGFTVQVKDADLGKAKLVVSR